MKCSRREVRGKAHALPTLKFENQSLTSFSGLVVYSGPKKLDHDFRSKRW
jgi:hypothetical protein